MSFNYLEFEDNDAANWKEFHEAFPNWYAEHIKARHGFLSAIDDKLDQIKKELITQVLTDLLKRKPTQDEYLRVSILPLKYNTNPNKYLLEFEDIKLGYVELFF